MALDASLAIWPKIRGIRKDRLKNRDPIPSISDARLKHFEGLRAAYEPIDEIPQDIHITINTQNALDDNIREILSKDDLPIPG